MWGLTQMATLSPIVERKLRTLLGPGRVDTVVQAMDLVEACAETHGVLRGQVLRGRVVRGGVTVLGGRVTVHDEFFSGGNCLCRC